MKKNKTSLLGREKHNRAVSTSRSEQQNDSGGVGAVEIDDMARIGAELLAFEV